VDELLQNRWSRHAISAFSLSLALPSYLYRIQVSVCDNIISVNTIQKLDNPKKMCSRKKSPEYSHTSIEVENLQINRMLMLMIQPKQTVSDELQ